MPTLVIDNVPITLYDRLQHLATSRQQTPADTALEVLEKAFRAMPVSSEAALPQEPSLSEEMPAPCSIPRPAGKSAHAVRVPTPLPGPHDLEDHDLQDHDLQDKE